MTSFRRTDPNGGTGIGAVEAQPPRAGLAIRIGVVYAGAAAIWLLILFVNTEALDGVDSAAVRLLNAATVGILGVSLVVASRRYLDRRRFGGLGLTLTHEAWRSFAVGAAAFVIPCAAGLGIAVVAGWVQISLPVAPAELLLSVAVLLVTVLMYEALPEELIFRGYFYRNLAGVVPPWMAALGQAVLFAVFGTALWVLTHGPEVLVERGTIFLLMGIVLGFIRIASASVWTCIGFHWAFQLTAQTLLGSRIDAHGPVELFGVVPAFALGVSLVAFMLRRKANWTRSEPDAL